MQEETADEIWRSKFQQLLEYYKEHGNSLVPQHYQYNKRLGSWVAAQRKAYRMLEKGKAVPQMNDWKIQQLESIEFVWYVGRNRDKILAQLEAEKKQGKAVSLKKKKRPPFVAAKRNNKNKNNNKKKKKRKTNHISRLETAPSASEFCVHTTELNDNDLELARLIANFPNTSNVVLDDDDDDDDDDEQEEEKAEQEQEQEPVTTQKYDYKEMNEYLDTIAILQDEVFSLQKELFALKSTTLHVQNQLRFGSSSSSGKADSGALHGPFEPNMPFLLVN
ncbi:MAG: hypothetical protein SGBAC_012103 [Bacillariaceae sp.]